MRKKIFTLVLCSSILFTNTCYSVSATSLSESKDKYTEVSSQLKELDTQIATLQTEINSLNDSIETNNIKIKETQDKIDSNQEEINNLNSQISKNKNLLDNRLREIYKNNSSYSKNVVLYLLKCNSISDLISRVTSAKKLVDMDNKLITDTNNKRTEVETSKKEIEQEKDELVKLNDETKEQLNVVNSKNSELNSKKSELQSELANISAQIEENEKNLVKNQISIANNSNDYDELSMAVSTLKCLLPQLSVKNIIDDTNSAIKNAQNKLSSMNVPTNSVFSRGENNGMPAFNPSSAKKTLTLEATAYTAHTTTAMGTFPIRNPNGLSSVAVDKTVIPLGTKIYVEGYGYAICSDTGSAIKGNKIDLFMNSEADCLAFGRQTVTAYIIAYPNEW